MHFFIPDSVDQPCTADSQTGWTGYGYILKDLAKEYDGAKVAIQVKPGDRMSDTYVIPSIVVKYFAQHLSDEEYKDLVAGFAKAEGKKGKTAFIKQHS